MTPYLASNMKTILHITQQKQWEAAKEANSFRGDTLDTEGFIHCSTPQQVIQVANAYFAGQHNLILLVIDVGRVRAEIRLEALVGTEEFPHIYGPLNLDAVVKTLPFEPGPDGSFDLPPEIIKGT